MAAPDPLLTVESIQVPFRFGTIEIDLALDGFHPLRARFGEPPFGDLDRHADDGVPFTKRARVGIDTDGEADSICDLPQSPEVDCWLDRFWRSVVDRNLAGHNHVGMQLRPGFRDRASDGGIPSPLPDIDIL